jgi:hypothetical protein
MERTADRHVPVLPGFMLGLHKIKKIDIYMVLKNLLNNYFINDASAHVCICTTKIMVKTDEKNLE